jgi:hypothetical protein
MYTPPMFKPDRAATAGRLDANEESHCGSGHDG